MKFSYRIIWVNTAKNKQEWRDVDDQNIACFIAKKKASEGMQNVIIQVTVDPYVMSDIDDSSWPAIDAVVNDIENEII